ncbi:MAG TPA: SH3 domain-containing protein [Longimicrobium sp.]
MDRRLIPTGALLAGLSIFLPYIQSPSLFGARATVTGTSLGGWIWAVPLAAGIILLGYMLSDAPPTQEVATRLMLAGCGLGLLMLVFGVYELTRGRFFGESAWSIGVRPSVGPFVTLAGFLLAFGAVRRLPRAAAPALPGLAPAAGNDAAAPAAASPAQLTEPLGEALAYGAAVAARQLARLRRGAGELLHGLRARYARNPRRVWGGAAVLSASVVIYLLFIRPSPEKLGRSTALAFTACRDAYAAEVKKAEQALMPQLARGAFRTRGEALGAWNQMLDERRPKYMECLTDAQNGLGRARERFKGGRLQRFFTEHNALVAIADPYNVEGTSQSPDLLSRLQSVRAPAPGENEVRQQLLGRVVDGWSFDEPSEFRALRLSNPRHRGDTLWLHAEADLTDYISQEQYLAVLELQYQASDSGDWQLSAVQPMLIAQTARAYKHDGAIFLIGRWRWPQNYAVYNADGTWSGRWDNGSELSGRWRIVRDRLVLTRGGSDWWSGLIQAWTPDSMRVGDGTGVQVLRWTGPGTAASATPAQPGTDAAGRRATINDPDGYTNLRAAPTTAAVVLAVINEGEEFSAYPSENDWWRARTAAGQTGYVHRSRIRLVP